MVKHMFIGQNDVDLEKIEELVVIIELEKLTLITKCLFLEKVMQLFIALGDYRQLIAENWMSKVD